MSLPRASVRLPAALAATALLSGAGLAATAAPASAAPSTFAPATFAAPAAAAPAAAAQTTSSLQATLSVPATLSVQTALSVEVAALARAQVVLGTAAALKGRPYRYGGAGPSSFDCSGFTQYVFKSNGIALPRTAQQQYRAAIKISKSNIRVGDLVFFMSGGYAYHVGVYAGDGMIWHSPHSGSSVRLVKIWTTRWVAGRVI